MRTGRMFHRDAQTYLVHVFGQGLEGDRYVIEKYRSDSNGQIHPVGADQTVTKGRRSKRRTIMSAASVKNLRPERDEIIVCTGVELAGSGIQLYGLQASGLFTGRYAR